MKSSKGNTFLSPYIRRGLDTNSDIINGSPNVYFIGLKPIPEPFSPF